MKKQNKYEKRLRAIQLYNEGTRFTEILQLVDRSKGWLSKWLRRYKEKGLEGLKDESRALKKVRRKTPEHMVRKILGIREQLVACKGRFSAFSGIGPEAIQWELKRRKVKDVPSVSTIARILFRHGKTKKARVKRSKSNQPYPYFKAEKMGDLHQTDIVGPRYLRGPKGVTCFYCFNTVDVAGHTAGSSQFSNKQTLSLCRHLLQAWRFMGLPFVSQLDNEMAAAGGRRYPFSLSQTVRLNLLLGIHLVFIPKGEPGRNACVESFNGLWQERVPRRHNCPALSSLKRVSKRFMRHYNYEKPHRSITQKEHGTRFPGALRDKLWGSLRHLPEDFSLSSYIDSKGRLSFPVASGKVSFVRKVNHSGKIEVNGSSYFIGKRLEGQYVTAMVITHRKRLVVKQGRKTIKSFSFPIKSHVVAPLLPGPKVPKGSRCYENPEH